MTILQLVVAKYKFCWQNANTGLDKIILNFCNHFMSLPKFLFYFTAVFCPTTKMSTLTIWAILSISISFLMGCKELYELISGPSVAFYLHRLENLGQLSLILLVGLTTLPVWTSLVENSHQETATLYSWQYQTAAVAVFLAWILILGQVGKTPRLGIYVEILLKVCKSFGLFVLTFVSLLTGFAFSFSILMPTVNISLNEVQNFQN